MNNSLGIFFIAIEFLLLSMWECKVCETKMCKRLVQELKVSMDNTTDPCDDFSSYICGNFDKLHSIAPGENSYNGIQEISNKVTNELKNLLEKQQLKNLSDPQTKAAIFYQSCLNMEKRNEKTKSTIIQFVKNITKGKTYEENLRNLLRSGISSVMISIHTIQDPKNPEYNALLIGKPDLILSEVNLKSPDTTPGKEQIKHYKKYMNDVLDILELWTNERAFIDKIVVLHSTLAKALPSISDQSNPEKSNNKLTITELQTRCSEISWGNLINGVLRNTNKTIKDGDAIFVFSLPYIDKVCSIIKEYKSISKNKILEKDIQWAIINSVVSVGSEKLLEALHRLEQNLYGITGERELWKTCLRTVSGTLVDIMGHMYIKNQFQVSKKRDIELIVQNVKKSLKTVFEKITWMDSKTKEAAKKKLKLMKQKIGYPDSLLSKKRLSKDNEKIFMSGDSFMENCINYAKHIFSVQMEIIGEKIPDDLWLMGPHDVNAYCNPKSNEIVFPAAILRYPFYDIELPFSFNYGGIGMIIGHETLHGFDTTGSKYDERGVLRDWWTQASREEYNKKTNCIRQQYKGYSIYNISLPSDQTIGEDMADNAGLRMAYMAAFSTDEQRERLTLSGLDFTSEQLFFVGFAKGWCSIYTKTALIEQMKNDVHSVWKYRINGPLSNMPEFSKAFKCDKSKKMNRLKKCLVW